MCRREEVHLSELHHPHRPAAIFHSTSPASGAASATLSPTAEPPPDPNDEDGDGMGELGCIHILLRPGHFDLLYPRYAHREQTEEEEKGYSPVKQLVRDDNHAGTGTWTGGTCDGSGEAYGLGEEEERTEGIESCLSSDDDGNGERDWEGQMGEGVMGVIPILQVDEEEVVIAYDRVLALSEAGEEDGEGEEEEWICSSLSPNESENWVSPPCPSALQATPSSQRVEVTQIESYPSAADRDLPSQRTRGKWASHVSVASLWPLLQRSAEGIIVLNAVNASAKSGMATDGYMASEPIVVCYDHLPIGTNYCVPPSYTPRDMEEQKPSPTRSNGKCDPSTSGYGGGEGRGTGSSHGNDFVLVLPTLTTDSSHPEEWEAVEGEVLSPPAHSPAPAPLSGPDFVCASPPHAVRGAFSTAIFDVSFPLQYSAINQDCSWSGCGECAWRHADWCNDDVYSRICDAFGVATWSAGMVSAVSDQPRMRVYSVPGGAGEGLLVPTWSSTPSGAAHEAVQGMAVVDGTTLCRLAIRGLAAIGSINGNREGERAMVGRDTDCAGLVYGDSDCDSIGGHVKALFEVVAFDPWHDLSGEVLGVDVSVCVDMNRYMPVRCESLTVSGNIYEHVHSDVTDAVFCEALATSLGLDTNVYTILVDCPIIATYQDTRASPSLHPCQPRPEMYLRGIETEVIASGEVAVFVHVVICGRRNLSDGTSSSSQPGISRLVIPLAAFASLQLLCRSLLQALRLDPSLTMQLCVQSTATSATMHATRGAPASPRTKDLRVLTDVRQVLAWCSSRFSDGSSCRNVQHPDNRTDEEPCYYSLYLKYCEAAVEGASCGTIYGAVDDSVSHHQHLCRSDDILQISQCGHLVCSMCLMRHLVQFSNESKCASCVCVLLHVSELWCSS